MAINATPHVFTGSVCGEVCVLSDCNPLQSDGIETCSLGQHLDCELQRFGERDRLLLPVKRV